MCHGFTAFFDDPNLVSCAGLAPVLQLAERAGLQRLVAEHVQLGKPVANGLVQAYAQVVSDLLAKTGIDRSRVHQKMPLHTPRRHDRQ